MPKWLYKCLILMLAAVFLVSGGMLLHYWLTSRQQAQTYDGLAAMVSQAYETMDTPAPTQSSDTPNEVPEETGGSLLTITDPQTGQSVEVLPEYAQLYALNNDLVGWISLPDTKLNYPVMQTPEKADYYLKRDFYREYSAHGCIYAKEDCDVFGPSDNLTLYGHYMKDGSMFAPLGQYRQKGYWQQHPELQFNTLRQHRKYEIFAVFITTASLGEGFPYHTFVDAGEEEEFDRFVAECKALSLYDTGITPTWGDKLLTLSTCDYSRTNGRLVVVARQLP